MSGASQRIIPLLAAAALGMVSGAYIFDPILRQYAQDTNGTFRPEDASSSSSSSGAGASSAVGAGGASASTGQGPAQSFTSAGEAREPSSGGVGNASVLSSLQQASSSSPPSSSSSSSSASTSDSGAQARAEKQRELAVSNASARAVEALQGRARKTGEGEVFSLAGGR